MLSELFPKAVLPYAKAWVAFIGFIFTTVSVQWSGRAGRGLRVNWQVRRTRCSREATHLLRDASHEQGPGPVL